jgi:hypothetical protein
MSARGVRVLPWVAAALLLGGCGGASGGGAPSGGSASSATTATGCPHATAPRVVARVRAGGGVGPLAIDGTTLWTARPAAGTLLDVRLGGSRPRAGRSLHVGGAPVSLAAQSGSLYVADRDRGRVLRIDVATRRVVRRAAIETAVKVVVAGAQVVAISLDDGDVTTLRRLTFVAPAPVSIPAVAPIDAAYEAGQLWILGAADHGLTPFDVGHDGFIRPGVRLPTRVVGAVAAGQGAVWVALPTAHGVARVDATTRAVGVLRAAPGFRPTAVAVDDCAVWAGDAGGRVQRLDPASGRPIGPPVRIGASLAALVADRGGVWASDPRDGTVVRVASTG